jgi:prepilin-type N-terminal cleavage/methylation domain-containing protein
MKAQRERAGYTLIELVVAILVFTVAALALAASSGLIAQAMATNALRERAGRVAASRIALIKSQCATVRGGNEVVQQIGSVWSIARGDKSRLDLTETVTYTAPQGTRVQSYQTTIWCRS